MNLLFLTILFPLIGFLLLAFSRGRLKEIQAAIIGVGSIGLAALTTLWVTLEFLGLTSERAFSQTLWTWVDTGGFNPHFTLYLDGLSLTMLGVVTGVGFLIHLFAAWYMRGEEGYDRFFAYMNLFVVSMLCLVLADNLLFLYFGWEGVGLCSYLLIGFYYRHSANGAAAMKAFVVTRVGDVFLIIGLFILYHELNTLNIQELLVRAPQEWQKGSFAVTAATLMLLGGAVGKSAQLPLHTWLADAMAGPTPVSALIHATTMVTAGVYLIARTHALFLMAPEVLTLVGWVGGITLLLAGFAALAQTDIKRILAYSTMSQIGYMFLALGAGAWSAAVFHLMTHAFFKALLFLAAGAVIIACHHEQNIFRMGGLRKSLPLAYASFLVGGAALVAVPYVSAGFYSKDSILLQAWAQGHEGLAVAGLVGAFLTALYTFRLIFIAFHGEAKTEAHQGRSIALWLPLLVLLVLSTFVGAWIHPPLAEVLPGPALSEVEHGPVGWIATAVSLLGIALAAVLFLGPRQLGSRLVDNPPGRLLHAWWYHAWGFDWLYRWLWVRPYLFLVALHRRDWIDASLGLVARLAAACHRVLSLTQTGRLRWYVTSLTIGAVAMLATLVFL